MYKIYILGLLLIVNFNGFCQEKLATKQDLYCFEGTYEFVDQHQITLGIFDELNQSLTYLDLKTLKIGALIQISKNTFREMNDSTQLFHFVEGKNGITGLEITTNQNTLSGKKIATHKTTSVAFKSGKNLLKGDLYLPTKEGTSAVVIFAHGSGPATRSVGFFTTFFLNLGIGVLTFDKQGAGESTGNWETASLDELADDLVAGVAFLKGNKDVDPLKIGMMGNSQGGWVGSIAASKTKDLSFFLMRVGSGESVFNTISHEYRGSLLADGYTTKEIEEIMEMYHENWNAARRGKNWEEGHKIILSYNNKAWFKKLFPEERIKTPSAEKWWIWLQKNLNYDSYPYLKQIKTPTLWLLAEKDWNVNSQIAYPKVKQALKLANNKDFKVAIIPNMAHNGMVTKKGYYNEPLSFKYAPGFWDQLAKWLKERNFSTLIK